METIMLVPQETEPSGKSVSYEKRTTAKGKNYLHLEMSDGWILQLFPTNIPGNGNRELLYNVNCLFPKEGIDIKSELVNVKKDDEWFLMMGDSVSFERTVNGESRPVYKRALVVSKEYDNDGKFKQAHPRASLPSWKVNAWMKAVKAVLEKEAAA